MPHIHRSCEHNPGANYAVLRLKRSLRGGGSYVAVMGIDKRSEDVTSSFNQTSGVDSKRNTRVDDEVQDGLLVIFKDCLERAARASMVQFDSERSYGEGLASGCNRELCMFRMRQCPPVRRHMAVPCPMLCSFGDSIV